MKRFSKAHKAQIDEALATCSQKASGLDSAIEDYNIALIEVRETVTKAVTEYNGALETLKAIYADIATEARDYYEERSEKWQEGEAGEQYSAWLDTLENVDLEDIDLELADDLDEPDHPDFDDPEGLPAESPDDM